MSIREPAFKFIVEQDYRTVCKQMTEFTEKRNPDTQDEIWFVEHTPVFTLGRKGNKSNILKASDIPVVESDRGGDITYHGPGQLVMYCLIDITRLKIGVKTLVNGLETLVINYLFNFDIKGHRIDNAPGVYVDNAKLASLGLRVRKGCAFHGLAINVDMDLTPFTYINPCGLADMRVIQLEQLGIHANTNQVAYEFQKLLVKQFYT